MAFFFRLCSASVDMRRDESGTRGVPIIALRRGDGIQPREARKARSPGNRIAFKHCIYSR